MVLLLGLAWSLATAPMGIPDESSHYKHAWQVWDGHPFGGPLTFVVDEDGQSNPRQEVMIPERVLVASSAHRCLVFKPEVPASCADVLPESMDLEVNGTRSGRYNPLYYVAVGVPSHFVAPNGGIYLARFMTATIVAALICLGVSALRRADVSEVGVAISVVAITPMTMFLAGGINPNGPEIAAGWATWATAHALLTSWSPDAATRRRLVDFAMAAFVFASMRPSSPWYVPVLIGVTLVADRGAGWRAMASRRKGEFLGTVTGIMVVTVGYTIIRETNRTYIGEGQDIAFVDAMRTSLSLVTTRIEQFLGVVGWLDTPLPREVLWSMLIAVGIGLWTARQWIGAWTWSALAIVAAGVTLAPVVIEAWQVKTLGFGWQGRYVLSLVVGLGVMVGARVTAERARSVATWVVPVMLGAWSLAHVLALAEDIRRFSTGVGLPRWAWVSEPIWRGPVPLPALLVLTTLGMAVLVAAATLSTRESAPRNRDDSP